MFEESLETGFSGSIYHPNLVNFDVDLDNSLEQNREDVSSIPGGKVQNSLLNDFHISSMFLQQKPYAFSLIADRSLEVRNREFFERQVISSSRYGGNFGFRKTAVPLSLAIVNETQMITRANTSSQNYGDNRVDFSASHDSPHSGSSRVDLSQDEFFREESGVSRQDGISRDAGFGHQYSFGGEDKRLDTSLRYYTLTETRESATFDFDERLDIEHNDFLSSAYAYDFSRRTSQDQQSQDSHVNLDLRQKLYESLNSSLNAHYTDVAATSLAQNAYGISTEADYTKKLGRIGKIGVGAGVTFDQESRRAQSSEEFVSDESHVLDTADIEFLSRMDVDESSVVVTDKTGTILYRPVLDYRLVSTGRRLQIQRIPSGSIADGDSVLVDYRSTSNPSFEFDTLMDHYRFKMDFLDSLCGISYRINREGHPNTVGQENTILQEVDDRVFGVYADYRHIRIEWEAQNYDSSASPYQREGWKETWFYEISPLMTYTLQASQSRTRMINTSITQEYSDIINRYTLAISRKSRLSIEGGYRLQRGLDSRLEDRTGRLIFEVDMGQFTVTSEYDYENQHYLADSFVNHYFLTRFRRIF